MIVRFLPLGPVVAEFMKQSLKETNINFRKNLPLDEIKYFAEEMFTTGVRTIFAGHFHREHQYQGIHSGMLYTVPDWFSTDMVTLFDESLEKVSFHHWMEL
jgi:UDP-2,3-diacylglucosamine pyrophosphatase LpxH